MNGTEYEKHAHRQSNSVKSHGRRYPWRDWFSKPIFTLHEGVDYNGRTYTMAQQVRNAAARIRHNLSVSIEVADDQKSLTVVVNGPLEGEENEIVYQDYVAPE